MPVDLNLHGAVSATSISDTASTVQGILATQGGDSTLRLTADGNVTATASAAGSNATGILASATASASIPNTKTYIVRANGDVTATSDGAATGISVTRGITIFAGQTAGTGGADLVSKGTVTANSTSAAAIGVRGFFTNDATNAATLSLRTEGNVIANGIAAGSYGIFAQRGGTGDIKIDVLAGVQSTGVGIGDIAFHGRQCVHHHGQQRCDHRRHRRHDLGRHHHAPQQWHYHRHRRHRGAVRRHQ